MRGSERCFHLVLLVQPFTYLLPSRIASMVGRNTLKLMVIGDFSVGYFVNKMNDCLMMNVHCPNTCGVHREAGDLYEIISFGMGTVVTIRFLN